MFERCLFGSGAVHAACSSAAQGLDWMPVTHSFADASSSSNGDPLGGGGGGGVGGGGLQSPFDYPLVQLVRQVVEQVKHKAMHMYARPDNGGGSTQVRGSIISQHTGAGQHHQQHTDVGQQQHTGVGQQ